MESGLSYFILDEWQFGAFQTVSAFMIWLLPFGLFESLEKKRATFILPFVILGFILAVNSLYGFSSVDLLGQVGRVCTVVLFFGWWFAFAAVYRFSHGWDRIATDTIGAITIFVFAFLASIPRSL